MAFSPDGETLASGGEDGKVHMWKVSGASLTAGEVLTVGEPVKRVAFRPDGGQLMTVRWHSPFHYVDAWNWPDHKQQMRRLVQKPGADVAFLPDRTGWVFSVAAGFSGETTFHDLNGLSLKIGPFPHEANVLAVAAQPGQRRIVTSGGDGVIKLWDATEGPHEQKLLAILRGQTTPVERIGFSADGKTLASIGYNDKRVWLWDPSTSAPGVLMKESPAGTFPAIWLPPDRHNEFLQSVVIDPKGTWIASVSPQRPRLVFHLREGDSRWSAPLFGPAVPPANVFMDWRVRDWRQPLAVSPDGKILAAGDGRSGRGQITLWDVRTLIQQSKPELRIPIDDSAAKLGVIPLNSHAVGLSFSRDGKSLATSTWDPKPPIQLFDVSDPRKPRLKGELAKDLTGAFVEDVAFSPTADVLAAGGDSVWLWDLSSAATPAPYATFKPRARRVVFSPNGKLLAAGSMDARLSLWDVPEPRKASPPLTMIDATRPIFYSRGNWIITVRFSPDGMLLANGSLTGRYIEFWDVDGEQAMGEPLESPIMLDAGVFTPDGKQLILTSEETRLRVVDLDLDRWTRELCGRANRNLSQSEWTRFLGNVPYRKTCPELPAGDGVF